MKEYSFINSLLVSLSVYILLRIPVEQAPIKCVEAVNKTEYVYVNKLCKQLKTCMDAHV